ncbi:MAG: TetR/AcrR family transcriptional regulator [Myxococcota bacterium]
MATRRARGEVEARRSPRKRPQQRRSAETVDVILTATAKVLMTHGAEGITTNRVAEVAGVSVGSLYQYFPSKHALIAALIQREAQQDLVQLSEKLAPFMDKPLPQALAAMVHVMVDHHARAPALYRQMMAQVPRLEQEATVRAVVDQGTELMAAFLESRKDELKVEDVRLAAFTTMEAVRAVIEVALRHREGLVHDPRFTRELARLTVRHLCGVDPPE